MFAVGEGIFLPFLGTAIGAACVFLLKSDFHRNMQRILAGLAAGIMTAASFWSLLLPAVEQSGTLFGTCIPAGGGFFAGVLGLWLLDRRLPVEAQHSQKMLLFAVTMHNIPEGMAVGAAYAGMLYGGEITGAEAFILAVGIAVQNIPEGAIISLPLKAEGMHRRRAFFAGVLSGAVEPVAAVVTLGSAGRMIPLMPVLLSFAAGAMLYVVVRELVPEFRENARSGVGEIAFGGGFLLMMLLDVAFG